MLLKQPRCCSVEGEKTTMLEAIISTKEEFLQLFHIDEPLWVIMSPDNQKLVLQQENYERLYVLLKNKLLINLMHDP